VTRLARAALLSFGIGVGVPILSALLQGVPLGNALTFIGLTLVFENAAVPAAVGLGLPAAQVLITGVSACVALFIAALEFLEPVRRYALVARLVESTRRRTETSALFRRYGMAALAPAVIFLSVKGCATVVWLTGWPRYRALAITLAGYFVVAVVVWLSTIGLLRVFLPGV
jgi:hypothetical protein